MRKKEQTLTRCRLRKEEPYTYDERRQEKSGAAPEKNSEAQAGSTKDEKKAI